MNEENKHDFRIGFNGTEKYAITCSEKLIKSILAFVRTLFLVQRSQHSQHSKRRAVLT